MGSSVLDQQLGCLWQKDHLLSISLSGYINYLDKNNPSKPLRVIKVSLVLGMVCLGNRLLWSAVKWGNRASQMEAEMSVFLDPSAEVKLIIWNISIVSNAQLGSALFSAAESHYFLSGLTFC